MERRSLTEVKVFLASPGDVAPERAVFKKVTEDLDSDVRKEYGLVLDLVGWEKDGHPGVGEDAQDVLNRQLPPGDITVVVLWNRVGTPTARASSGTIEEFENAYQRWRNKGAPLMVYFKTAPAKLESTESVEQRARVIKFRESLEERGVYFGQFESTEEFEDMVRKHLRDELRRWSQTRQATERELSKREPHDGLEEPAEIEPSGGDADPGSRIERFYSLLVSLFDQVARLGRPVALPGFFNCTACFVVIDARLEKYTDLNTGPKPPLRSWDGPFASEHGRSIMMTPEDALIYDIPRVWLIATQTDERRDSWINTLNRKFELDAASPRLLPLEMKEIHGAEAVDVIYADRISVAVPHPAHHNLFYAIKDPAGIKLMRTALQRLIDAEDAKNSDWEDALGDN